jgi:hypothetical protein
MASTGIVATLARWACNAERGTEDAGENYRSVAASPTCWTALLAVNLFSKVHICRSYCRQSPTASNQEYLCRGPFQLPWFFRIDTCV